MLDYDPERAYSKTFFTVTCPCGKTLRAKLDMAGSEIRCWSCHAMVPVPIPRSPEKTRRALAQGFGDVFRVEWFGALVLAAAVVTGLLAVPYVGIALATGALVVLAYGYGEVIRAGGEEAADEDRTPPSRYVARGLAALALGLSVCAPFWLAPGGLGQSIRLAGPTLAVLAVGFCVVPLALVAAFGSDQRGPLPWRGAVSIVRWHPLSVLLALALVPLAALGAEALLFLVSWHFGLLSFLMLDLMPRPELHLRLFNLPLQLSYGFGTGTEVPFLRMYGHRLTEGYTLLGAIPPSLATPKQLYFSFWSGNMENQTYFLVRIALTQLIITIFLVALALQARWLGLVAALDARRAPAPAPVSVPIEAIPTV